METGKTTKYLKYAIGEIILVMIGILLALQVNNWNENRKQKIEEIQILKNIRTEFKNTIDEFKENNVFREQILISTKTFLNLIHYGQPPYDKPKLDSIISNLFVNPTYNGQSETLNILFNSGKINIINNEDIKNALVKWPQLIEDITEDEIYSSNILFNTLQPIIKKHVSLYDIYRAINFKNYELFHYEKPSTIKSDYEALLNDREFEGTLVARELPLSISLLQSRELIDTAQNIITLIDKEIYNSDD